MKEHICIPAVRLPDGEVLQGEPHVILALRAIERGITDGLVAGHIDSRNLFQPVYEKPEDVISFKVITREYGIQIAEAAGHRMRWAAGKLLATDRDDHEGLKALVDRFDSLCNIGLSPAIKNNRTGEVFYGVQLHGELDARHPELCPHMPKAISDGSVWPDAASVGWVRLDSNQYISRQEAAEFSVRVTGVSTGPKLISGEEWFCRLSNKEDAAHLSEHWHEHGVTHARSRLNIFKQRKFHPEYSELLEYALDLYAERKKRCRR